MELSIFKKKRNELTINGYTIAFQNNNGHVLRQGAYGIVYRAVNRNNETGAAKTINGKIHQRILNQDLNPLTKLDHGNIVMILEFYQQDETFWMFMELCCYGDLNKFFVRVF